MAYIDLARERAFRLGPLEINPAQRRVAHDDSREELLEPRVMQVLVALAKAGGRILSRDELMECCWRGVVVGDDALNRVIGRVRRLSEGLGAGVFEIGTITKVGYRLLSATEDQTRLGAIATAVGVRPALALPSKPSIAVLPFKNLSGVADQEYLADAVSEDIVTALSRWRWFFVIARHSSFTFKNSDHDPVRIGQELGVRYLLSGGVRVAGQRIRVTAQLVDALTGSNLWAEKFDHQLSEVFVLQDEVSEQVAAAIAPAMLHEEAHRTDHKPAIEFSALDRFYRGMWCLNQFTANSVEEGMVHFREAVRLDHSLALAHAGIGRLLYGRVIYGVSENAKDDLTAALASARTAIRLDPREASAHFAASGAELYLADHASSLESARLSLTLNPNFALAHYRLGQVLIFSGQPKQAIAPLERAFSLSPCDPQLGPMFETLALAHFQAGDYEQAVEFGRATTRHTDGVSTVLVASLAKLGRFEEAVQALGRTDVVGPSIRRPIPAPYASKSDLDHVRDAFRLAREARERGV
ncbi:MAG: winged helix-turn-helix domain-containing protein [Caulobacteraceae bacterium]|jgi:TolB-like protein/Flp pilus assembly protein TadD